MLALLVRLSDSASVGGGPVVRGRRRGCTPECTRSGAEINPPEINPSTVTFWCGLGCCSHLFYLAALAARSWGQLLRSWGQLLRGSPRPLELLVVPPRCHSRGQQAALTGKQLAARPALPRLVLEPWCRASSPAQVASTPPARSHPRSKRTWK